MNVKKSCSDQGVHASASSGHLVPFHRDEKAAAAVKFNFKQVISYSNDNFVLSACCDESLRLHVTHPFGTRLAHTKVHFVLASRHLQFPVNRSLSKVCDCWVQKHSYGLTSFDMDALETK